MAYDKGKFQEAGQWYQKSLGIREEGLRRIPAAETGIRGGLAEVKQRIDAASAHPER